MLNTFILLLSASISALDRRWRRLWNVTFKPSLYLTKSTALWHNSSTRQNIEILPSSPDNELKNNWTTLTLLPITVSYIDTIHFTVDDDINQQPLRKV